VKAGQGQLAVQMYRVVLGPVQQGAGDQAVIERLRVSVEDVAVALSFRLLLHRKVEQLARISRTAASSRPVAAPPAPWKKEPWPMPRR
jgi:hypothetical protein